MALKLEKVIPIGRRLNEYMSMFGLNNDLIKSSKIIDCGGGPSSFNYEATVMGAEVTSIDPIYQFTADQVSGRVDETFDPMFEQVRMKQDMFVWEHVKSVDELIDLRRSALKLYLNDFAEGKAEGRYEFRTLPSTGYGKSQFDLALCSHFLFLYSEHLSFTFHLSSIKEMLRIAEEVRIFPVIDLKGNVSPHLEDIMAILDQQGYDVDLKDADYEFLKGANQYLRIKKVRG